MNLINDIHIENLTVIIEKFDDSDFDFICEDRYAAGIILITGGSGNYYKDKKVFPLKSGILLILNKGDKYRINAGEQGISYITTFFDILPEQGFQFMGVPQIVDISDYPHIKSGIRRALDVWNSRSDFYIMESRMIIEKNLLEVLKSVVGVTATSNFDRRISPAISYIGKNFEKPINNEYLAELCDLSVTHFRRIFTRELGVSPLKYREKLRIDLAIKYIESETLSVSEIAEKLGYSDVFHFSKNFKNFIGKSPLNYK